ncbi:conjugal transfer protein TrbE [Asticcacaulis sp.]|uniref:conjugal transfer protein TrbE n=1 Tax=Asticcacaulis sp. TaxID=1872648 RepID=UPI002B6542F5|nr:conjugal transfer protein TrbE [Asticcacaulis sp.]HTM81617.1 conjugal transfer protein TrbE [Asticcacaulis sp.]
MLNLRQYRPVAEQLADHLPWAALVAPGVILNKDGSFQRTLRYYGPDLDSATSSELVGIGARVNNILRRFGEGWALFFEARRREALGYPSPGAEDGIARLVDEERRAAFEGQTGRHFETHFFVTLVFMPAPDTVASAGSALLETTEPGDQTRDWKRELLAFVDRTDSLIEMLAGIMPFVTGLDDAETLSYLHSTISTKSHTLVATDTPIYLDAVLADTPLLGGLAPMLGDQHLRSLTVLGFPNHTQPGLLDGLNHLDSSYRWTSRFIALDKEEATKTLTKIRRQWFNKRKSVTALLREVMYSQQTALTDSDADNKVADADQALQALGGDHVSFGYLTTTITVMDADARVADEKLRQIAQVINGLGFTTKAESLNAVEAWLGSLPGHVYANVRQPLVHSLNLVHLMPLSAVWAGPERNDHLAGPPLLHALSSGSTPFRLSTHVGDVGHMLILGPTGAGKSVLLAFLALQFQRYPSAQTFIFDKGYSARAVTLAMGGSHHVLGRKADLAFQPLSRIDDVPERIWALEWLILILENEHCPVTPEVKEALWSALDSLAAAPAQERTLTGLSVLLSSNSLKSALRPFTLDGAFGHTLDAEENGLDLAPVHCFETEDLMGEAGLVLPVLTYLFHRLEERFDGRPTLLILDEAWVFLDNPLFAARIREWLKTLRKKNVSVIFATQSLADIADSSIAPAIIESCPQRLFLPNERAREPQSRDTYARMGLNSRQIDLIGQAIPKRQYYLQSRRGNRLFDLALGPIALAVCSAASPEDQQLIDAVLEHDSDPSFATGFLRKRGLDLAAELLTPPP